MPSRSIRSISPAGILRDTSFHKMTQTDWDRWRHDLREVRRTLEVLLENPQIWWALEDDAQEGDFHAFVRLSDLP